MQNTESRISIEEGVLHNSQIDIYERLCNPPFAGSRSASGEACRELVC